MNRIKPKTTEWFTYFPDDYRWSAAIGGMLGTSVVGASDMGEIDRTARKLSNKLGDDEAWCDVPLPDGGDEDLMTGLIDAN